MKVEELLPEKYHSDSSSYEKGTYITMIEAIGLNTCSWGNFESCIEYACPTVYMGSMYQSHQS